MKLLMFLLTVTCLQVSAIGYSQDITLVENNAPLKRIFEDIYKQTGYQFVYSNDLMCQANTVSINVRHEPVKKVLADCLKDQPFTYKMIGNAIILKKKTENQNKPLQEEVLLPIKISGKVTDSIGNPLIGVTVKAKEGDAGTVTDAHGNYSLTVPDDAVLVVSYVGYRPKEVSVNGRKTVDIVLTSSISELNQLVVVGYGTQAKKDITGSVDVVSPEELKETPVATFAEALQGKASGVYVSTTGAPGSESTIRIRGVGSINGSDPLVVVDGISNVSIDAVNPADIESISVLKDASATAIYGAQGANGVIVITTKQGSRDNKVHFSYNGYVGVAKMANHGYDLLDAQESMEFQAQGLVNLRDIRHATSGLSDTQFGSLDANDHLTMPYAIKPAGLSKDQVISQFGSIEAWRNSYQPNGSNSWSRSAYYQMLEDGYPESVARRGTNWYDLVVQDGFVQNQEISLYGSGEKSRYSMSFNYLNKNGTIKSSYFKRYSLRLNTSFSPTKYLTIGQNTNIAAIEFGGQRGDQSDASIFAKTYTIQPWVPVYNIGGDFAGSQAPNGGRDISAVELASIAQNNWTRGFRGQSALFAELKPIEGLTIRTQFSARLFGAWSMDFEPKTIASNKEGSANNSLNENANWNINWQWTNTATYSRTFNHVHNLSAVIGSEAMREHFGRNISAGRINYIFENDPNTFTIDNGSSSNLTNGGGMSPKTTLFGLFGRVDYTYSDKYLATVTVRRDASSKFGENNRWATFPSASLGWRISKESFMSGLTSSWMNDLKLRVGYGTSGNSNIGEYNYAFQFATGDPYLYSTLGDDASVSPGYAISNLGDPNAKWETIRTLNTGIDASLFNYKLDFSFDFYIRKTTDMLVPANWSALAGNATKPSINIGDMKNTGIDVSLGWKDKVGEFSYSLNGNISLYRNKVVRLGSSNLFNSTRLNEINITTEGEPVGMFYGYNVIGIYKGTDEVVNYKDSKGNTVLPYGVSDIASLKPDDFVGRYKIEDVDGDGKIDADDKKIIGNPHPDFTGGLHVGLGYKNFDLSTFMYFSVGNDIFRHYMYYTYYAALQSAYSKDRRDNSWNPTTNPNGIYPLFTTSTGEGSEAANESNSMYIQDGSYLRMQSLIIGYSLPKSIMKKIGLQKIRFYFQMSNVFTITKYSGLDPEIRDYNDLAKGVDYGSYGVPRQQLFGVNVDF